MFGALYYQGFAKGDKKHGAKAEEVQAADKVGASREVKGRKKRQEKTTLAVAATVSDSTPHRPHRTPHAREVHALGRGPWGQKHGVLVKSADAASRTGIMSW